MNIYDAAKILGLSGALTPEATKKAYKKACKKYHPDLNPAGAEMMKAINVAYAALKDFTGDIKANTTDYGDLLNSALNAVVSLSGVVVEVCGAWVWVTGDTRTHKDILKGAGYKWAHKKKAWYFRPEGYRSKGRGNKSLDEIREKYGSSRPYRNNSLLGR